MATEDCFERIERAFRHAAEVLNEARIPFLLGGSLAAWVRGGPESCNDLDLMIRAEDAGRALEACEAAGMRTERPAEGWLVKAWFDDVLIDLIFDPMGVPIDDEVFGRAEETSAWAVPVQAMALEDVLVSKLLSLDEHALEFESLLQIVRAIREQFDWNEVRRRTRESPYARGFLRLLEELDLLPPAVRAADRPKVRVVRSSES